MWLSLAFMLLALLLLLLATWLTGDSPFDEPPAERQPASREADPQAAARALRRTPMVWMTSPRTNHVTSVSAAVSPPAPSK